MNTPLFSDNQNSEAGIEVSNPQTIRAYFEKVQQMAAEGQAFPVSFNDVWPLAYSTKGNALKALENGFMPEVDYQVFIQNDKNPNGGRPESDCRITLSCMEYFIARKIREVFDVYRQVFHRAVQTITIAPSYQIDDPIKRAERWIEEQKEKQLLEAENAAMKPKADYVDAVLASDSELTTTVIAKELGKSAIWLNKKLHELRIQFKQNGTWVLYQVHAEKGYAQLRTHLYADTSGKMHTKHYLVWTEAGRKFINERLNPKMAPKQSMVVQYRAAQA